MAPTTTVARPKPLGNPPPTLLISTLIPIAAVLITHPLLPLLLPADVFARLPLPPQPTFPGLQASIGFAMLAFVGAIMTVPLCGAAFIEKGLKGRDLLKPGGRTSGPWIPECIGLPCASLYILLMMLFIPFPFSAIFKSSGFGVGREVFPTNELALFLTSLLSLLTATMLGFIDDLFDIRWRHKLPIPLIAAVPTLMVYYAEGGYTWVVLPASLGKLLRSLSIPGIPGWVGTKSMDLGILYYVYLALLPTFTTNSINILAGVNGVEVTQALIIAMSVALNDLFFLPIWPSWLLSALGVGNPTEGRLLAWAAGEVVKRHLMSLYFMIPLIGVCAGFLIHNWYPARAFPGDTFCYFTGMAFSAVAIQGHFPKTLILFFVPQIFNFVLSCPQLFRLVECPRHRLPHFNPDTGLLEPSRAVFDAPPPAKTRIVLRILEMLRLTRVERAGPGCVTVSGAKANGDKVNGDKVNGDNKVTIPEGQITSCTNLTILNLILVHFGPMHESTLCASLAGIQVLSSLAAFTVRYGIGSLVYGGDRR